MADAKLVYYSPTTIANAPDNLANSFASGWQTQLYENTNNWANFHFMVKINFQAGTPAAFQGVQVYAFGCLESTVRPGAVASAAGTLAFTWSSDSLLRVHTPPIGFIGFHGTDMDAVGGPYSLAEAFGGYLPKFFGVAIANSTGFDLQTGNTIRIEGLYYAVA